MVENIYMNRCLTLLVTREVKIKTTMKHHYILTGIALKKRKTIQSDNSHFVEQ